jgi:hypothetical protein
VTPHDPKLHEPVLIELLADDATQAEAAFARSELAGCDVCREIAEEHVELARKLDGLGGDEREVLVSAETEAVEEGAAEGALRALIESETSAPSASPGPMPETRATGPRSISSKLLTWVAAAAAVLLVVLFVPRGGDDPVHPGPGPILGPGDGTMNPEGEVEDFSSFTWTHELPEGGWFKVWVYREGEGDLLEDVGESPRLEENAWRPPAEVHEAWPDDIIWKLDVSSGIGGDVLDGGYSSAQRSSP